MSRLSASPRPVARSPGLPGLLALNLALALALALGLGVSPRAVAQETQLRPGLWEQETQLVATDPRQQAALEQMRKQFESMPPAQREQLEAMMARQGIGLGAQPNSLRLCLTREQLARGDLSSAQPGCTQEVVERSATRVRFRFSCVAEGDRPASSGEGDFVVEGPTAYHGTFNVESERQGKKERVQMSTQAKWVGSDCGAVQPSKTR